MYVSKRIFGPESTQSDRLLLYPQGMKPEEKTAPLGFSCSVISDDDFQHSLRVDYDLMLSEAFQSVAPSGSLLVTNVERYHLRMFVCLDVDETLILTQRDHNTQVRECLATSSSVFRPDFIVVNHGPDIPVEIRSGAHDFLQIIRSLYRVFVLTAGTREYAQEVVKMANERGWKKQCPPSGQGSKSAQQTPLPFSPTAVDLSPLTSISCFLMCVVVPSG